ncbi:sugar kinase [Salinicola corii]|uniref:Sugar kinase n=1 Tax=Salinicola corii TaxID=2606937 RepID=A0A640WII9_9GAMM|nr:PfkB family carbohydrate kinase [Salinicola corii]KAA0020387.1 sugar kinase [Salinicola corii]
MTDTSPKLWHTGQAIVDIVMTVEAVPTPGSDVMASSTEHHVGGGFNVMTAARRYGMRVVYAGGHGIGPMGERVREALRSEDVILASDTDQHGDSGFCVALIDGQGERTFVSQAGVESRIDIETLDAVPLMAQDWIYVSGYSLAYADKAAPLLDWLDSLTRDIPVVFDPGPMLARIVPTLLEQLLPRITLWSSNADETRQFTGIVGLDESLSMIAHRLSETARIVVRDGPRGCWLREAGKAELIAGFPSEAIDTNGAGDAHTGVLIAALAEGVSLHDACVAANAAAAIAVSRRGPATAPHREELERYLMTHRAS